MCRAEGPCRRIAKLLGGARCACKLLTQTNAPPFTLRVKGQPSHLAIMCGSCPARPSLRLPYYLLGKRGTIESIIRSVAIDNDEGTVARTAESKPHYVGSPRDGLRVEIFDAWLAELRSEPAPT
jgi:hypothetical protein